MMKDYAISLKSFNFAYASESVLEDISFDIKEGEYVSIIGPNGVGKSTLLKSIMRIVRGYKGRIEIFGKSHAGYSQRDLGKIISYVSQSREQVFPYTVLEFILMGRYPHLDPFSRLSRRDHEVIDNVLEKTGLTAFVHRPVLSLSGGERQKVYIAGALAQSPRILLLDEPTTHLDPKFHAEIQALVSNAARECGMTVLHVTHELSHIQFWADKVLAFKNKRLWGEGTPQETLNKNTLREIFDSEFLVFRHPESNKNIIVPEISPSGLHQ